MFLRNYLYFHFYNLQFSDWTKKINVVNLKITLKINIIN